MNLAEVIVLLAIILRIAYILGDESHPFYGLRTSGNLSAMGVALCATYKKGLPDGITEPIENEEFRKIVIYFMMGDNDTHRDFSSLIHVDERNRPLDEWGKLLEYKKTSTCRAILKSHGKDTIPNTEDDIVHTIDCYCF